MLTTIPRAPAETRYVPARRGAHGRLRWALRAAPDLDPATIEAIAVRVIELLERRSVDVPVRVDANEIARRFSLSRSWVYEHAADLGAVSIGTGSRPRLRFNVRSVADALAPPRQSEGVTGKLPPCPGRRSPPAQREAGDTPLLPIHPPGGRMPARSGATR